ncbi:cell wall hydrolase [Novosphingobium kunmingense]|uniref:Cell wall hydrolase n=1 Tax=Novosphingobium kunmingense TaxID=1211806 RepID=A0A2N0H757_9SPHN|nr:cell wall hydrolase [Novosphingobium kunmingense]PKB14779.1 cell wall hydrolase [Novosphingobium kunmingense]
MTTRTTPVLDLALPLDLAEAGTFVRRWKAEHWLLAAIVSMAVLLGLSFAVPSLTSAFAEAEAAPQASVRLAEVGNVANISVDDKEQIVVEGQAAQDQNAAIPTLNLPLEHLKAFGITAAKNETYATALKCLTQAVYYEAAVEPLQGRRAVAQVVLNRMRHPAYPKSVCGVVYQGAERRTGCQFSFTCDGALLRTPSAGPWREAEIVAKAALAGTVEPSVGTATFYHADYVLPKWAFQLGKIGQIGRHIFYRFGGAWGAAATFTGRYAGTERIPALDFAALRDRALADGMAIDGALVAEQAFTPGLTVTPDVKDRHAANDVGGRIDMTKAWRPSMPDPVAMGSRYQDTVAATTTPALAAMPHGKVAVSDTAGASTAQ